MSEDEKKLKPDALNEGYQPLKKGYVPTKPSAVGQDGFTPSASGKPATPPQTVPNLKTSVKPSPENTKE